MTGEAPAAYEFLEQALREQDVGDELAVWLETLAAETAATLGADDAALDHYRAAIALRVPPSIYLLTAYADGLLRAGRAADVVDLLESAPPADPILLRLALAQKRAGESSDGNVERLRYRLELALQGVESTHAREAAYFALNLLDRPELALERALANWQTQREPIDARLVLEAALAAGRAEDARPVVDWLAASNVRHAELDGLVARLAP
jgi:hypothetical protein